MTPHVYGNRAIARSLHERRILLIGDSLSVALNAGLARVLSLPKITGYSVDYGGCNYGFIAAMGTIMGGIVTKHDFETSAAPRPSGETDYCWKGTSEYTFNGDPAPTDGGDVWYTNRIFDAVLPSLTDTGDREGTRWFSGSPLNPYAVTARLIYLRHPNSPTNLQIRVRPSDSDGYPGGDSIAIDTWDSSGDLGIQYVDVTIPAPTSYDEIRGHRLSVRLPGGRIVPADKVFVPLAVRFFRTFDGSGAELHDQAAGGYNVQSFRDTAKLSDNRLAETLAALQTEVVLIRIGANDLSGEVANNTFQASLLALMARLRAARPGVQFVLCSTYALGETDGSDFAGFTFQMMRKLRDDIKAVLDATAIAENDAVMFDEFAASPDVQTIFYNYLSDGAHPNVMGRDVLAGVTNALYREASSDGGNCGKK